MATVALAVALTALWIFWPFKRCVPSVLEWADSLGVWGASIIAAFYIPACLLVLPGSIITVAAGFFFGVPIGVLTALVGANVGACAAFLVARTLGRERVTLKIVNHPKFAALNEAVGKEGFKIVLLLRLSPILPFNILNYALGLTKISFRDYALASIIGMLPEILVLVYFGSAVRTLTDGVTPAAVETPWESSIFFWIGFAVTLAVAALVALITRRNIKSLQQN
jgi:uncharacterized membrane protein YdjX (TVP38/TMEM64 family)